jgi:predicted AAA+ superfamily ATPase
MFTRLIRPELVRRLAAFPAVALVGPRQCGKTTLAKSLGGAYFDLEQQAERLRLDLEWDALIKGKPLVVLDEAHTWPEVFPRMRGAIDAQRKRHGRFLILGSIAPALMTRVSESLAGRLSLVELTPLLWRELTNVAQRERLWLCGGFADGGVMAPKRYPRWQRDYLALLAQRDLPAWGLAAKPQTTERLMAMLAALHGQAWNASNVGQSMGLSYHTVNSYLDYLAGAFLIRRLPPFSANIGKRLVKSPKVYWRDSGLLHSLLGVSNRESLLRQPWVGASWEGFVIEQILGQLSSGGRAVTPYYFRTSDQHELDLVLEVEGMLWAFEIKLTSSPSPADMAGLDKRADMIGAKRRALVSQTSKASGNETRLSCNLDHLLGVMANW